MNRVERSLIKVYKDLVITRRELVDLRQSISKTLKQIKEIDIRNLRKVCAHCGKYNDPALPHHCRNVHNCHECNLHFQSDSALRLHQEKRHAKCDICYEAYESKETHDEYLCPQTPIKCDFCNVEVKRKQLQAHAMICCFRECYKCKGKVYSKVYAYHLTHCGKLAAKKAGARTKKSQEINRKQSKRPFIVPCSLSLI